MNRVEHVSSRPRFPLLMALGCLVAGAAVAGTNSWTPIGPDGGQVVSLAADPRGVPTVYAGTLGAGIFKTVNGGGSWTPVNTNVADPDILVLATDSNLPNAVYAGGAGGRVFKSTDGGANWVPILTTNDAPVHALLLDRQSTATVYAGTEGEGVLVTTNNGVKWKALNDGLTDLRVFSLAVEFGNGFETLYAGTETGVFKSTDVGATWTRASDGLHSLRVESLAVDPETSSTLYAGTTGGVFKSVNRGGSWALSTSGLGARDVRHMQLARVLLRRALGVLQGGLGPAHDRPVEDLLLENHLNSCVHEQMTSGQTGKAVGEVLKVYKLKRK